MAKMCETHNKRIITKFNRNLFGLCSLITIASFCGFGEHFDAILRTQRGALQNLIVVYPIENLQYLFALALLVQFCAERKF